MLLQQCPKLRHIGLQTGQLYQQPTFNEVSLCTALHSVHSLHLFDKETACDSMLMMLGKYCKHLQCLDMSERQDDSYVDTDRSLYTSRGIMAAVRGCSALRTLIVDEEETSTPLAQVSIEFCKKLFPQLTIVTNVMQSCAFNVLHFSVV